MSTGIDGWLNSFRGEATVRNGAKKQLKSLSLKERKTLAAAWLDAQNEAGKPIKLRVILVGELSLSRLKSNPNLTSLNLANCGIRDNQALSPLKILKT